MGNSSSIFAHDIGETLEVADGKRPHVAKNGSSPVASYGVVAVAGTEDSCKVHDGEPPDVDTVAGIVGDRNASAKMEIGALFHEDTGPAITADGCGTGELHRRVFGGVDTAAGNWSIMWTSIAVSLDNSSTIDLQMGAFL